MVMNNQSKKQKDYLQSKIYHIETSDKLGFYIDEDFVEKVEEALKKDKESSIKYVDQRLCGIIIAEFLSIFEVKIN